MLNLPNTLSLLRAPLAILFLIENPWLRSIIILLAALTDSIDGFLARKSNTASRLGALLDPAMDKCFVTFCLGVMISEGHLQLWEGLLTLSREFSLCFFALYLNLKGLWKSYEFRSILWGKITTILQFILLIQVSLSYRVSSYVYILFLICALFALIELFQFNPPPSSEKKKFVE